MRMLLCVAVLLGPLSAQEHFTVSSIFTYTTDIATPWAVALADIDGDGVLDAASVSTTQRQYACYRGASDGTFTGNLAVGSLYLEPTDIVAGDFNGDGIVDLAGMNSACTSWSPVYYLSMVMGSQGGGFGSQEYVVVGPEPVQIEAADFNKDGLLDLAVLSVGAPTGRNGSEYARSLAILLGDGSGGFLSPYTIALAVTDSEARFAVGDFNGDSWLEAAVLEPGSQRVRFARNDAASEPFGFHEGGNALAVGPGGRCIAEADWNGDGTSDLALAREIGGQGTVQAFFINEGGGATQAGSAQLSWAPQCMASGRIGSDSVPDIVVGGAAGLEGRVAVFGVSSSGTVGAATEITLPGPPTELALGDMTGDGIAEVVCVVPDQALLVSIVLSEEASGATFLRGDANSDLRVDISDAIGVLSYLFLSAETDCLEALDANDDGTVNLADAVYLLQYLFAGASAPPAPFPEAGPDPDPNGLGCTRNSH